MTDEKALVAAIVELGIATGGKEPDEGTLAVYAKYLIRFELSVVLAAIDHLILTLKFFPSISEIVAAMGEGDAIEGARAWALALEIVRTWPPEERDARAPREVTEAVRLLGGWRRIGQTKESDLHFLERDFLAYYQRVAAPAEKFLKTPDRPLRVAR